MNTAELGKLTNLRFSAQTVVTVSLMSYVGGVPVRGTLILSRRHSEAGWPVPFLAAFNFPIVATRYPFAAGWTVGEHPNYDPRVRREPSMFCSQSSALTTWPLAIQCKTWKIISTIILKSGMFSKESIFCRRVFTASICSVCCIGSLRNGLSIDIY